MVVLLTGASGFLGKGILKIANQRCICIRPVYRSKFVADVYSDAMLVSGMDDTTDWFQALQGIDVVIHAAARSHKIGESGLDSLTDYRKVNVQGTINLARQAAALGVRRFVFISSIKVNGELTLPGCPFTANDVPAPEDAYGISKAEAEVQLMQVAKETGMEVTIIRPPLIYGAGVKGNLSSLIRWLKKGLPLPLGAVTKNRRSLVGLDNLVDLILVCLDHPLAANQIFLISDDDDQSTYELLIKISTALGQPIHLIWFPVGLISMLATLMGKRMISERLLSSLQVDISKTCDVLDWRPSITFEEGIRKSLR